MHAADERGRFEYPDASGYPDGVGTLDEGTAELIDEVTAQAIDEVDRPSADTEAEIVVRRVDELGVYSATIDGRQVAGVQFAEVENRTIVLTTTVLPEFRGRGIATALIADALDDLRERGRLLTVRCPVVAAFITGTAQYRDLAASIVPDAE
jgi:predicted GNAT family acetyltransferase